MKKLIIILSIILIALSVCSCGDIAETRGIRVYKEDYIKKYGKTLDAMFENDWNVVAAEDKYMEHEEICDHVDTRPEQYIEWTVEYHDGNGDRRLFTFDNRSPLSGQIADYVKDYIADYYKKTFYDELVRDIPTAPSGYVFGFFAKMTVNRDDEDNRERTKKADEYLKNLDTPEGTICLSRLTPANVFEMCPFYLSINVSFGGHPEDKKGFEESVKKGIEDMIAKMNGFTASNLNASICMGYHDIIYLEDGKRDHYWHYIQGRQVFDIDVSFYERYVFDRYKGVFW